MIMRELDEHYLKAMETSVLAANEIMRIYQTSFFKNFKSDGSPVTEADTASSDIIINNLEQLGIPIICEEDHAAPYEIRKNWSEVWLVDPLDGTKEFIRGNGEFAVNIALVKDGRPIFGLIASPVECKILFGGKEIGAFICSFNDVRITANWQKLNLKELNSPVVMASSRTPYRGKELDFIDMISQEFEIDFLKKGSALKFFDLAQGIADVYPRFAPTMEWDIASGQAILEALGGTVVQVETGDVLTYNKESLYNPNFIAKTASFLKQFN